jgi:hypothetical protein
MVLDVVNVLLDRAGLGRVGIVMSATAAPAFDEAGALDAFAPMRANYERFAFLLFRKGQIPGLELGHLEFRVLLFLLGQKPGAYAAHQRTIAEACNTNTTSVRQALARLRAAGLVLWELIPPHHALPTGRYTRTNVCRYWVNLARLVSLLEVSAPPPPSAPARSPKPETSTPPRSPKPEASTPPNSGASYGTRIRSEQQPPPLAPVVASSPASEQVPPEGEANSQIRGDGGQAATLPVSQELSPELATVGASWEKIGLGELDCRARRALENRRREGATLEQLEAAVIGAGADEWIRYRAKVPFAVVFASVASIERFAHEGRRILEAQTSQARREAEERRRDREWREQRSALRAEPPPTLEELRRSLPEISTAVPSRPLTPSELAQRRAAQLLRAEAWLRENGDDTGP